MNDDMEDRIIELREQMEIEIEIQTKAVVYDIDKIELNHPE